MSLKELMLKTKAAYEHGKMDYHAGAVFDPDTPLIVYNNLSSVDQSYIKEAYSNGFHEAESAA